MKSWSFFKISEHFLKPWTFLELKDHHLRFGDNFRNSWTCFYFWWTFLERVNIFWIDELFLKFTISFYFCEHCFKNSWTCFELQNFVKFINILLLLEHFSKFTFFYLELFWNPKLFKEENKWNKKTVTSLPAHGPA